MKNGGIVHVGEVDVAEVDASGAVGVGVRIEERGVGIVGETNPFVFAGNLAMHVVGQVCAHVEQVEFGVPANVGVYGVMRIQLSPYDVSLDTMVRSIRLADFVMRYLLGI